LRHIAYAEEVDLKKKRVADALERIAGCTVSLERVVPSPKIDGYRNKCAAPVGYLPEGGVATGFYRAGSHEIVPNTRCALQRPEAGPALEALRAYAASAPTGLFRHGVVRVARNGGTHLCAIAYGKPPGIDRLADRLRAQCPSATGLSYHINREPGNAIWGNGRVYPVWGEPEWTETLSGLTVSLSPKAFFQVNPDAAELLYGLAVNWAGEAQSALDIYCGTGVLTCLLARRMKCATGIDIEPSAIRAAGQLAQTNDIQNVDFVCGDAAGALSSLKRTELVALDPPRSGISTEVMQGLLHVSPPRILYISCDPATLARDIRLLSGGGYRVERIAAVDMFPRTPHVECVAMLSKHSLQ
jgi:23S rRNA (uracil1939-C5)-methyltransferase